MYRRTIASNSQRNHTQCWKRRGSTSTITSTRCSSPSPVESDCEELPRRQIYTKSKCAHPIRKALCSSCYCNANPIPPVLQCEQPSDHCFCYSNPAPVSYKAVHSVLLKHSPNCKKPAVLERYTKHRLDYENQTSSYFTKLKTRISLLEDEMKTHETLNEFRSSHYFETHDVGATPTSASTPHTCLHKFKLDNRLKPQPENPDPYGVSRCNDCNKIISYATFEPSSRSSSHTLDQQDETSKFTIKRGEETVVIEVPLQLLQDPDFDSYRKKSGRPPPVNSMALKFQKGVY